MNTRFLLSLIVWFAVFAVFSIPPLKGQDDEVLEYPVDTGKYLGPTDLVVDQSGQFLYITERDASQLRKVRTDGSAAAVVLSLPFEPERLIMFPDGSAVAVVGGGVKGRLVVVDCDSFKITVDVPVGHSPAHVAVYQPENADETAIAYVCNRFGGDISVVDIKEGKETKRLPFGREPIAIAVTPDGKRLIVVPHLPEDKAVESGITIAVRIYETESGEATVIRLRNGIINGRDVVLTPDGQYAFITCTLGHFENVPTHVDGGWMVENMIMTVDMETKQYADSFYLDDFGRGNGNPWGICCSSDGKFLAVIHAGNREITLFTLSKLMNMLNVRPHSNRPGLGAMTATNISPGDDSLPTRMRIPIGLAGARHLAMHGNKIYFTAYFEDSVGLVETIFTEPIEYIRGVMSDPKIHAQPVRLGEPIVLADIAEHPLRFEEMTPLDLMKGVHFCRKVARLGPEPVMTEIRYGNQLFHEATICYEQWVSCVSCHPDGRTDCLNWDLLNDGIGNPKNTKSMLLSHETPPSMISGVRADAETAVRSGIKSILFAKRPESEALAMDEYLKSLQPVPSPYLVDGKLSESAERGKKLFNGSRARCSDCHPAPLFTDMQLHDVDTRTYRDTHSKFDTPTLVEVWRTSPYLHDGRYITIKELITDGKHVNLDGCLDKLSDAEIDDLVEYVLSL